MTEPARRLLKALIGKGHCAVVDTGLTQREVERGVADLVDEVDDDNRHVVVVKTWNADDRVVALELTDSGRGLAYWA